MPDNRAPAEGTLFSLDARLLYQADLKYAALRYSNHKLAQRCDDLARRVAELEAERDRLRKELEVNKLGFRSSLQAAVNLATGKEK